MTEATGDEPRAVRVSEAARRLSISRAAAYELVANGTLPAARLGPRMTRIPVAAIEELLDRASTATTNGGR